MAELEEAVLEVSEPTPGSLAVRLVGTFDLASVQPLAPEIDALLGRAATAAVVDLTDLEFMDTSGVAVLLRIANRFGRVEISGASPIVRRSIEALGLSERLRMDS